MYYINIEGSGSTQRRYIEITGTYIDFIQYTNTVQSMSSLRKVAAFSTLTD